MQIPYGRVVSYGCLAQQAGYPGASRAVGGAMAANPIPIIVPCHRVVAASGALTGYSGPGGIVMKKNLLSLEGVEFRGKTATSKIDCFTQEVLIKK
jgi:methylated-DNA-[protein]-cysteine S-methyltransferase